MGALQRTKAGRHQTWVVVGGPEKTKLVPLLTVRRGRDAKGSSFEGMLCFQNFQNFSIFCHQQIHTHTPARACTRHPAKQRSKGLTYGLATAQHRLHCYVDHNNNSGCCSGYEPARGEAQGHCNNLPSHYATVSFCEMSRAFPMKFTSRHT